MKDAKSYDPNVDKAGFEEVPIGQRVEQVMNGGEGSGNFGHEGRPGEVGGSGGGGGVGKDTSKGGGKSGSVPSIAGSSRGAGSAARNAEKSDVEHSIKTVYRDVIGVDDVAKSMSSHLDQVDKNTSMKKAKTVGFNAGYSAAEMMIDSNSLDSSNINGFSTMSLTFGNSVGKISGKEAGLKANSGFQEGFYKAYKDFGERTNKEKNAETMQPGTAFVPQGNKTEMVTNPPYQTPNLGDAPPEMQKEADRIYKDLRKNQYHAETEEDRGNAAGTMWKILKESWEQDKDGKWHRKKKE